MCVSMHMNINAVTVDLQKYLNIALSLLHKNTTMVDFIIFSATVAAILVLLVAIIYWLQGSQKVTTVPGPDISDPLKGNLPDIAVAGSMHAYLKEIHAKYGPIVQFGMPHLTVSICSPALYKQHAKVFDRPPEHMQLFEPLLGADSITFANKEDGRMRHAQYARCYSHVAMENCYSTIQQMSDELLNKWCKFPSEEHIPLRQHMFAFSLKAILQSSYGKYFEDEREVLNFKTSFDIVWNDIVKQISGEFLQEGSPRKKVFDEEIRHMYETMAKVFEEAKQNPPEEGDPMKLIDVLISMDMPERQLAQEMMTIFVGGFHTTSLLLTWAIYFLATHKHVQDKAYDEVSNVMENEKVSSQSIPHLVYLRQVLDETLRCSVFSIFTIRVQDFDSKLGGHMIPKGTPVVQALGVTLSDPQIWPEPEKFDPERFNEENCKNIPKFAFEPFGFAGGRKCPGYRFSLVEATIFLADVLRKFEISMVPGQVVVPVYGIMPRPKEEIWITICKRK